MATKKAASSAKKSTTKKPTAKKQSTTKVTTVKAVESRPASRTAATSAKSAKRFGLTRTPLMAALIAEFVGTFIFAAVFIAGQAQPILALFALAGVVFAVGSISGGYINPALVVGAWVTKRMNGLRALAYIVAQILGAMLALVILSAFVNAAPQPAATDMFSTAPALFQAAALPDSKAWLILVSEFVGMLIFGFVVASALRNKLDRTAHALTVGLGVFIGLMVAGSAAAFLGANAVINPAVAVSLQAINFASIWPLAVYFIGPMLGAIVGFMLFDLINVKDAKTVA